MLVLQLVGYTHSSRQVSLHDF